MELFINLLQKLNPKNSLFGRILVWFWVAVTIMVVMAFFIARYFSQSWEISALENEQLEKAQVLQKSVQHQIDNGIDLRRALRRVSARGRWNLMAINVATNELVLGFPGPLLTQKSRLLSLKDAHHPLLVRANNIEFSGPFLLTAKKQEYQLFVGELLRRDQRPIFAFGLAFSVFLLIGTIACIAIAWTIAKPIKQLSKLSKDFAAGAINDSSSPPNQALKNRKDELGQLHNDIHDMASNLAKSLSQQKALMANISHELRTPLTRLQLALAMLNPNNDEQEQYAKRIEKDIGVMDALIGQALQLAKMGDDNQAQWMQVKNTDLHSVLKPALEDLEFEASARNITLEVNNFKHVSLGLIQTSFVSAIENVTRNAIKYAVHKVKVTVDVKTEQTLGTENARSQAMLSICIEDDGEGLTTDQMMHIFEPFYRVSTGNHYQGTGLGLAIAKASVQLHQGEIKAQSSQLGGLRLTMLFPIKTS